MLFYFHTNYFPLILFLIFVLIIFAILGVGVVITYKTVRNLNKEEIFVFDRENKVLSAQKD